MEIARSLTALEAVIERGLATFVEVGAALLEIRDGRAYHDAGYADFDTYCRERWGWSKSRSNQLIEASEVVGQLATIVAGPAPANEAQARELARIEDPAERAAVWREVAAERGIAHVTAARIRETAERRDVAPEPPTPWERAAADPGLKWLDGVQAIYGLLQRAEHAGGLQVEAARWTPEARRRYVVEIRRIKAVLEDWEHALEGG